MLNQLCNRIIKTSHIGLVEMFFWLAVYGALNNGLFIWGELAWLSGLAHKAEIIFIRRSRSLLCWKFVMLEKFFLMTWFLSGFKFLSILGLRNKLRQNFDSSIQSKCSYIVLFTINWKKQHLAGLVHLRVFMWKIFISPRWDPSKIKWDPT